MINAWEAAARAYEARAAAPRWDTPGQLHQALDPGVRQTPALDLIDREIVAAFTGEDARLVISMPPQEGKTERVGVATPVWALTRDPDRPIIVATYAAHLGVATVRRARDLVADHGPELGLELDPARRAAGDWGLAGRRGGVRAVGIWPGGSTTGFPAGAMIIDDPVKGLREARSPAIRNHTTDWFRAVSRTRLAPGAPMVVIMTRWAHDDLAGWLTSEFPGRWRVVNIPAIADEHTPDSLGPTGRHPGGELISARGRTPTDWSGTRREVGRYVWSALYQGCPTPAESGVFTLSQAPRWVRAGGPLIRSSTGQTVNVMAAPTWRYATLDLAASTRTSADWTVAAVWALTGDGTLVLLDLTRAQVAPHQHWAAVRGMLNRWRVRQLYVEESQHGTQLAGEAARAGVPLVSLRADTDKLTRALPAAARLDSGMLWLPAEAPWLAAYERELTEFPAGAHDDQVDVTAYAARVDHHHHIPISRSTTTSRARPVDWGAPPMDIARATW